MLLSERTLRIVSKEVSAPPFEFRYTVLYASSSYA